jgi:hypothetical protein
MSRTTSRPDERKSGRVLVRMPISMHEYLFDAAQAEGISMNQFICGLLAVAVDWRKEYRVPRPAADVQHDLVWEMWGDRVRRGDVPPGLD